MGGTPSMNGPGKSDRLIVPVKVPNNAAIAAAEVLEGRGLREGNAASKTRPGLRAGYGASSALVACVESWGVGGSTSDLSEEPSAVVPHAGSTHDMISSSGVRVPCGG